MLECRGPRAMRSFSHFSVVVQRLHWLNAPVGWREFYGGLMDCALRLRDCGIRSLS